MRKLCACLLLSGLMVVGCNRPSSNNNSGRNNAGATGQTGNAGRTSNYGPTGTQPGASGANGGINNPNGAQPPNANVPPAPGHPSTPGAAHIPEHGAAPGAIGGAASGAAGAAASGHPGGERPNDEHIGEAPNGPEGGAALSPEQFATRAWQGDAAEVKLAQLAEKNGTSEAVKNFAKHMVEDHSKANEQLGQLMKANNWTMPQGLSQHDQTQYDRLAKLKGQEFDRAYMQQMVQDHEHDIQIFQQEARSGKDTQLQGFAKKTLPVLQQHLHMAQQAAKEVGGGAPSNP